MPAVVDISNSRSPKKTPGKPKPPPGPKPALIFGVSAAVILSILFLVWFFALRGGADGKAVAPYNTPTRNLNGANGGAAGGAGAAGTRVAPGLPGDGG